MPEWNRRVWWPLTCVEKPHVLKGPVLSEAITAEVSSIDIWLRADADVGGVCAAISWPFQGIYGGGQKVAEEGLLGGQIAGQGGHMGGHTVAEWGLMGEEAEEDAGLKLAAGLAMAESFGSCSGACNSHQLLD